MIEIDLPTGSAEKDKGIPRRKSHNLPTRGAEKDKEISRKKSHNSLIGDEEKDQETSRRSLLEHIPMEVDHNLAGDKYFDVFDNDN